MLPGLTRADHLCLCMWERFPTMHDLFVSTALIRHQRTVAAAVGFYASARPVLVRGTIFRTIGFSGFNIPLEFSLRGICNNKRKIYLFNLSISKYGLKEGNLAAVWTQLDLLCLKVQSSWYWHPPWENWHLGLHVWVSKHNELLTWVSLQVWKVKCCNRATMPTFRVRRANRIPRQFLGPAPKGRYAYGSMVSLFSLLNLDNDTVGE